MDIVESGGGAKGSTHEDGSVRLQCHSGGQRMNIEPGRKGAVERAVGEEPHDPVVTGDTAYGGEVSDCEDFTVRLLDG